MLLTLETWAAQNYERPPKIGTLRRWARDGEIHPAPVMIGNTYHVQPNARHITEAEPRKSLVERLIAQGA